jgi:hypothetical protein
MKLITELHEDMELISEGTGAEKQLYIKGPYLQSEITNRNGRIYREHIMDNAVRLYTEQKIANRTAYGELNHPDTPAINLERVSHRIVELVKEGTNYIGKSIILPTPMGNIARGLHEGGCNLGVSSRGLGTLTKTAKGNLVNEDFRLATAADIVSDPSAPDAFVNGIMEGVDWVWNDQVGPEAIAIAEKVETSLAHNRKALNEQVRLQAFNMFIQRLGSYDPR